MSSFSIAVSAMAVVGSAVFLYLDYSIIDFLALHFILPSRPLSSYKCQGSEFTYALITGASAGIDLGVAKELLAQGFGFVLLGHIAEELNTVKAALERQSPNAAVRLICADARTATPDELQAIVEDVGKFHVSILVNNVGGNAIQTPAFRELRTYSCADVDVVIEQNARFMARITALMIPILSRKQKWLRRTIIDPQLELLVDFPENWPALPTRHLTSTALPFSLAKFCHRVTVAVCLPINSADEFGRCIVKTADGAIKRSMKELCPCWIHDLEIKVAACLPESIMTSELLKVAKLKKDVWDEEHKKSL